MSKESAALVEWTHQALCDDLESHLRGNTDRMVFQNITMGQYHGGRPDVFTVMKSFANFRADTYEIKVSRSDFLSDVTSGKWRKYLDHSHSVWFAVPEGMIKASELPDGVGLTVRGSKGWRSVRKAKPQAMDTLPRDAWLRLVMDLHPLGFNGEPKVPRATPSEYQLAQIARKRAGKDLAELIAAPERYRRSVEAAKLAADRAIEQHESRKAEAMKQVNEQRAELLQLLGLPPESSVYTIGSAMRHLRDVLDLRELQQAKDGLDRLIKKIQERLPEKLSDPAP